MAESFKQPEPRPSLPLPPPIEPQTFEWLAITPSNIPHGKDWVYFALTPDGFRSWAMTEADTIRFIREIMAQVKYYQGEESDE